MTTKQTFKITFQGPNNTKSYVVKTDEAWKAQVEALEKLEKEGIDLGYYHVVTEVVG